jgi:beta-lactamase regulating signal transducer with metallopeptidase domain
MAGPWCIHLYLLVVFLIGNEQAIAVYTFCVLVLRWSIRKYISKLAVLTIWIVITLAVVIPYIVHKNERIYGNVGYCKSFIAGCSPLFTRLVSSLKGAGYDWSSRRCNLPPSTYGCGGL